MLVDAQHEIVHLSPHAGRYLQIGGGALARNLVHLVPPALQFALRTALYQAVDSGQATETARLLLPLADGTHAVRLLVWPAPAPPAGTGYLLVLFDDTGLAPAGADPAGDPAPGSPPARQLEAEVGLLRHQLHTTSAQYATSLEDVHAANEELQAMNEELRVTGEELETSQEELQALNEELLTVNAELKLRVEEVLRANSDLQNLMRAPDLATLFLNRDLQVQRFTPAITRVINLIPSDLHRPLAHLTHQLQDNPLVADATAVLHDLQPREREVTTTDGAWYLLRLLPYRTLEDRIDGVVLTFVDITARKQAEEALRASETRFRAVADLVPDLLWRQDRAGATTWYNQRWHEYTGQRPAGDVTAGWEVAVPPDEWADVQAWFAVAQARGEPARREQRLRGADGTLCWFLVQLTPVREAGGAITQWFGSATDVQAQRLAHDDLEQQVAARTVDLATRTRQLEALARRLLAVQDTERQALARELHDEIGQYLTGLRLLLESAAAGAGAATGGVPAALAALADLTTRVREMTLTLRPPLLDDLGLGPALVWLTDRYSAQTGIAVALRYHGLAARLPAAVETAAYRVVQEALTNVARHAGVQEATVQLLADGQLTVLVEDAGRGFDVAATLAQGATQGLTGMRERVALLSGEWGVESTPGAGTRVLVELPLPAPDGADGGGATGAGGPEEGA